MTTTSPSPVWAQRIDAGVRWGLRHWLLFANGIILLYGGIPWLSPLAYAAGHPLLGRLLFLLYTPLCHQHPASSFFLYGYQVAYCHRETAMYTSLFVGGLLFGLVRKRIKPVSLKVGGLLLLPMLIDGTTHIIDEQLQLAWRTGDEIGSLNFWLRMITGVLFAIAVLICIYPRFERDLSKATTNA